MPDRRRKTHVKPAKSPRAPAKSSDATLAELVDRAERVRQKSGHLIEQMRELASEIAEAKAKMADRASGSAPD